MTDIIKSNFKALIPLIVFLILFVGSGLYYASQNNTHAFYQISPIVAIVPAIVIGCWLYTDGFDSYLKEFLTGVRNENIIVMCLIYLLAGSFAVLTNHIGTVHATIQLGLKIIPSYFLLPGIFVTASFIATAMGTSMGTIATMTPLALNIALQTNLNCPLCIGAVVGGAMFGDNLSWISDTTIASVATQNADMKQKFILNLKFALPAMAINLALYFLHEIAPVTPKFQETNYMLIIPYIVIFGLSLIGFNVFAVLLWGISSTILLGFIYLPNFNMAPVSQDILKGCGSMQEILVLSLLMGGLSHIMYKQGGLKWMMRQLQKYWEHTGQQLTRRTAQVTLCLLISLADLCTANNTIAIILCGPLAKQLQHQSLLTPERSACLIDIFSCVFQGLLPYSAQILLASSIAGLSPLTLIPYVYYCPLLGIVTFAAIYVYPDHHLKNKE